MKIKFSLGTIIFWGFIGWMWFGDTITEVFHDITKTTAVVTVNGEKKVIDVDKLIDNAVKKAEAVIESVDNKTEEPEPEKPTKREKTMVAEPETNNKFGHDDVYGNTDDKWR